MKKKLLAFLHINKAAGTTLTHLLRLNFFLKHFDIQQLFNSSAEVFQTKDLIKIRRINPFIKSIAGHNIRVFSDLSDGSFDIRYITLLRDPLKRTISHYKYSVVKHSSPLSFDEYLKHPASLNRQTRIIAGTEDLDLAKYYIAKKFFLVGIVEEFDEFLILLKNKLDQKNFKLNYKRQNIGTFHLYKQSNLKKQFSEYKELISKRNNLDIQLYKYVKEKILTQQKREYGKSFESDVMRAKDKMKKQSFNTLLLYLDYFVRKIYYRPMAKFYKRL